MKKFSFKKVLKKEECFFIAEAGVNHHNKISLAEKIIKQASLGGANAIKFQTYKAEKLASKNSPYYWDLKQVKEKSQYKLFKKFDHFNQEDYFKLKKICDHYKIIFSSTPFDLESVEMLDKIVPFFKIASADLTNLPLIEKIAKTKKPILISTGASNINEIKFINNFLNKNFPKNEKIFMHCILSYPTNYLDANLQFINILKKELKSEYIGYSDHTMPDKDLIVLTTAYLQGARVIEKHFTEKSLKGKKNNDHFHSIDYHDIIKFKKNLKLIKKIVQQNDKRIILKSEKKSRLNARRSIFTNGTLKKNQRITIENLIVKRPGTGISPLHIKKIIGKKSKKNLYDDHLIKWSDIRS